MINLIFSIILNLNAQASEIFYANSDHECMQSVTIYSDSIEITQHDNLIDGFLCNNKKSLKFLCSGSSIMHCHQERLNINTLSFYPGMQINYTGGFNTTVFRASRLVYKAPHTFKSNKQSDVGFTESCSAHAKEVAHRLINLCNEYTTDCKVVVFKHAKDSKYPVYCTPEVVVTGKKIRF